MKYIPVTHPLYVSINKIMRERKRKSLLSRHVL